MTYLQFNEIHDTGKTKVWAVTNSNDGSFLGEVRWYGAWRKYVLWPQGQTIWSPDCLADAAAFIEARMAERRAPAEDPNLLIGVDAAAAARISRHSWYRATSGTVTCRRCETTFDPATMVWEQIPEACRG